MNPSDRGVETLAQHLSVRIRDIQPNIYPVGISEKCREQLDSSLRDCCSAARLRRPNSRARVYFSDYQKLCLSAVVPQADRSTPF